MQTKHLTLSLILTALSCLTLNAQSGKQVSPEVLHTVKQYAGKDANPVVPVAMLSEKISWSDEVASWLAAQRGNPLVSIRLIGVPAQPEFSPVAADIPKFFANAAADKKTIYISDADTWFKAPQTEPASEEKTVLIEQIKKYPYAVILSCHSKECWFNLAKSGFGIVRLD